MKKLEKETAYKIMVFHNVRFNGDWEIDIMFWKFSLRMGRSQVALWYRLNPIFMWLATYEIQKNN